MGFLRPDLILVSIFVNVLALAVPVYVIQAISRYLAVGEISTLYALTAFVLFCVVSEWVLRRYRVFAISRIGATSQEKLLQKRLPLLAASSDSFFGKAFFSNEVSSQLLNEFKSNVNVFVSLLDLIFLPAFLILIYIISPIAFFVLLSVATVTVIFALVAMISAAKNKRLSNEIIPRAQGLIQSVVLNSETVRLFTDSKTFFRNINTSLESARSIRVSLEKSSNTAKADVALSVAILTVLVVFTSVIEVFEGQLSVGSLIALNILCARTLVQVNSLPGVLVGFLTQRKSFFASSVFASTKTVNHAKRPEHCLGSVKLNAVGHRYSSQNVPLFENFEHEFVAGTTTVITGENGAGKSTLFRIITGSLTPTTGSVLLDGVNISQLDQNWWRQQLAAVPQEPNLLDGTLLTNLKALRVNLGDEEIQSALNFVGLDKILNQSNDGLEMNVVSNNSQLSLGIRKRFALARAILINGKVVIMDEPTEGLDDQGAQAFYRYLNRCVEESRTVILLSHDKAIIKGADFVIDLNSKPTPKVVKT